MNKSLCIILASLTCYTVNAQVQITTLTDKNDHLFPLVYSKNTAIAKNINSYLQSDLLSNEKIETSPHTVFENAKYISTDSNQQAGYTSISYKVEMNNAQVLSLSFDIETMGAYPDHYNKYYNFNLQTGKLIVAKELFTSAGLNYLKKFLSNERKRRINQFLSGKYPLSEDSTFIIDTYKECNRHADLNNLSITAYEIVFYKEYCFPHVARSYDTDLNVTCKIKQLEKYLTVPGKKLLRTQGTL